MLGGEGSTCKWYDQLSKCWGGEGSSDVPILSMCRPSTSFSGATELQTVFSTMCLGNGS